VAPDLTEHAALRDGTRVVIRPLRPDDKERLRRGFERLSPESRYLRFFSAKQTLTDAELRYLTEVDGVRHVALGAARIDDDGNEGDGLGVARYIQLAEEPGTAEAAIVVVDEVHGQGLGTLLFDRLVAVASERGVARFRCDVLGENAAMVDMIEKIAPERTVSVESGVMSIVFDLPSAAAETATPPTARESPMFRFFRMVAQGAHDWQVAMRRLALGKAPPDQRDGDEPDDSDSGGGK
jgi:GNAT superfamily N-acetyltransferase